MVEADARRKADVAADVRKSSTSGHQPSSGRCRKRRSTSPRTGLQSSTQQDKFLIAHGLVHVFARPTLSDQCKKMQADTILIPVPKTCLMTPVSFPGGNAEHDGGLWRGTGVPERAANVAVKAGG